MGVRIKRWNFKMLGKLESFNFLFCKQKQKQKQKPQKKPKKQTNQKKNNLKTKLRQIAGFWDLWFLLDCHIITVLWEEASLKKKKCSVWSPDISSHSSHTGVFFSVCFCSFLLKCNMYRFCSSLYVYLCGTAAMSRDLHWTRKERPAPPPPLTRKSAADTHGHACAYWAASCPSTPRAAVFM